MWRYSSIRKITRATADHRAVRVSVEQLVRALAAPSAVPVRAGRRWRAGCSGSARITTRSAGSSSSITARATCRSRRATRCRCTALPTAFDDHQTDPRVRVAGVAASTQRVHDEVGLHRPHPLTDCGTEFRRPRHPVPRRKHRARSCVESRSQLAATLATPARTRSPGRPGSASAAGTRAPAHGAGCWAERSACPWPRLSLLVAFGTRTHADDVMPVGTRSPLVSSSVSLASRRGLQKILVRSRIATFGRLFEGTDEISLGQTSVRALARNRSHRHSSHRASAMPKISPRAMLQNGWHSDRKLLASGNAVSTTGRRQTTKRGCPHTSRAHRTHHHCDEPRPAASPPVDNRATTAVLSPQAVDNYVDSSSSFILAVPGPASRGYSSLTADPDPPFVAVWNNVVAELNGDTAIGDPINGEPPAADSHPSAKGLVEAGQAARHHRGICPAVGADAVCAERDRTPPARADHHRTEPSARPARRARCPHRQPRPPRIPTTASRRRDRPHADIRTPTRVDEDSARRSPVPRRAGRPTSPTRPQNTPAERRQLRST